MMILIITAEQWRVMGYMKADTALRQQYIHLTHISSRNELFHAKFNSLKCMRIVYEITARDHCLCLSKYKHKPNRV